MMRDAKLTVGGVDVSLISYFWCQALGVWIQSCPIENMHVHQFSTDEMRILVGQYYTTLFSTVNNFSTHRHKAGNLDINWTHHDFKRRGYARGDEGNNVVAHQPGNHHGVFPVLHFWNSCEWVYGEKILGKKCILGKDLVS